MSTTGISPGWYPDPLTAGCIRYWDGSGWTDHTAAPLTGGAGFPAGVASQLPVTPRAPRQRPPLPALFVLGTVLIGFPIAITIGVLAARASAPPALEVPVVVESRESGDAVAKTDGAAIGAANAARRLLIE